MIIRRFIDLDNTIIFSYRHDIGEKVAVEYYQGRQQSYMPVDAFEILQTKDNDVLIPLTSRTLAQYERVRLFADGRIPQYALLDNGGILLINGKTDKEWTAETERMLGKDIEIMKSCQESFGRFGKIKLQDGLVYLLKLHDVSDMPYIEEIVYEKGLMIFRHMDKVYICSQKLTKGNAIKRFVEKYHSDYVISAGDSWVDVSMMEVSDAGVYSADLQDELGDNTNVILVENKYIFQELMKICT